MTKTTSLARKLVGYAQHGPDCHMILSLPSEEGTSAVISPCTCGLDALVQEAMQPPDEPSAKRCETCGEEYKPCPTEDHPDQLVHICGAVKSSAKVVPSICGKPMPDGKGAGQCINVPGHEGDCDDMPF